MADRLCEKGLPFLTCLDHVARLGNRRHLNLPFLSTGHVHWEPVRLPEPKRCGLDTGELVRDEFSVP